MLDLPPRNGTRGALANRKPVNNYQKYLKFRDLLQTEMGIRAEAPTQTALTVLYRDNKMLMGLVGGKCTKCGTPQFPKSPICVNPDCNAFHSQEDHEFADSAGYIKAFTGDLLSVSVCASQLLRDGAVRRRRADHGGLHRLRSR